MVRSLLSFKVTWYLYGHSLKTQLEVVVKHRQTSWSRLFGLRTSLAKLCWMNLIVVDSVWLVVLLVCHKEERVTCNVPDLFIDQTNITDQVAHRSVCQLASWCPLLRICRSTLKWSSVDLTLTGCSWFDGHGQTSFLDSYEQEFGSNW